MEQKARSARRPAPASQARAPAAKGAAPAALVQLAAGLGAAPARESLARLSAAINQPAQRATAGSGGGLPPALKAGVESLSGLSMDGVRVHRNSAEPARLGALAFARGTDIHLGPGQDQHLPHEAWHVVQQASGRVRPTLQLQDGTGINDDAGLEREADRMGSLAASGAGGAAGPLALSSTRSPSTAQLARGKRKPLPTPETTLSAEESIQPEDGVEHYVMADESEAGQTRYEETFENPQIFWRGDTRGPGAVFETGFTTANERDGVTKKGANRIIWRAGGGLDDVLPASAICLAKDIRGSAFFPLTGASHFYLYAVAKLQVVNTFRAQQDVERRDTGAEDFRRAERYQYDPAYQEPDKASAVWQFQEVAAHRVESNEILAAFKVDRRTLVPPHAEENVAIAGIQFKLEFMQFGPALQGNRSKKEKAVYKGLMDQARAIAARYETYYPDKNDFLSYMGIVTPTGDRPESLEAAKDAVRQKEAVVVQERRAPGRAAGVVQRVVIPQGDVPGLAADLDTTQRAAAMQAIARLHDGGRRASLNTLLLRIAEADRVEDTPDNKALIAELNRLLSLGIGDVPESAGSGFLESAALKLNYLGTGTVDAETRAGLRLWVSGDPARGINWRMVGSHLRGALGQADYEGIGALAQGGQQNQNQDLAQAGRAQLDGAAARINAALAQLPPHEGPSYRQSAVANPTVYGGIIHVGDYVRDPSFLSTSALRIDGSAGRWGAEGTQQHPKAYFIIQGRTGRYISKAAAQEEGQHEVLFRNDTAFHVDRITNIRGTTFFVYVTEAGALPLGATVRNPYNGNVL